MQQALARQQRVLLGRVELRQPGEVGGRLQLLGPQRRNSRMEARGLRQDHG